MAGVKGMKHSRIQTGTTRQKMWRSMRVKRRFTAPDICRTSGAQYSHAKKFINRLAAHDVIAKLPKGANGQPGNYNGYRLVKDLGPICPLYCPVCGQPWGKPCEKENIDDGK